MDIANIARGQSLSDILVSLETRTPRRDTGRHLIRVRCMECGKPFSTVSSLPECPKCGGSDIEPR